MEMVACGAIDPGARQVHERAGRGVALGLGLHPSWRDLLIGRFHLPNELAAPTCLPKNIALEENDGAPQHGLGSSAIKAEAVAFTVDLYPDSARTIALR